MSQDDTDNNRKLRQVLITYHSNIVVHDFTSFNIERACKAKKWTRYHRSQKLCFKDFSFKIFQIHTSTGFISDSKGLVGAFRHRLVFRGFKCLVNQETPNFEK